MAAIKVVVSPVRYSLRDRPLFDLKLPPFGERKFAPIVPCNNAAAGGSCLVAVNNVSPYTDDIGTASVLLQGTTPLAKITSTMEKTDFFKQFEASEVVQITWVREKTVANEPWINITGFFSRLQQDVSFHDAVVKLGSPLEQTWLKGLGQSALCFLIADLLAKKRIGPKTLIHLEASGFKLTSEGKMGKMDPKLVNYYMSIGFWYPNPPAPMYALLNKQKTAKELVEKFGTKPAWEQILQVSGFVPLVSTTEYFLSICNLTKKHIL